MLRNYSTRGEVRSSALWGTGSRNGESRSNALSSGRGRAFVVAFVLVAGLAAQLALASSAGAARMPKSLRAAVKANPTGAFKVIVEGTRTTGSSSVETKVKKALTTYPARVKGIKKKYVVVNGLSGEFSGQEIASLDSDPGIAAIVPDTAVRSAGYSNNQWWPNVAEAPGSAWTSGLAMPTIAVVDSGVDATRLADFGARVLKQVNFTSLTPNSAGDGRGHGTFVASIAAGQAPGYAGFAPTANLVSLDVLADDGQGLTSDVIAAADWIYQNKDAYGIRVANFSLTGSADSSFIYDPLDKAVEKLWLSGVVVVAASGNYAVDGLPSGVRYAPSNDPFVISVGAADTDGSFNTRDDFNAPWSAYGYTYDGFAKPEIAASGRYMNGAAPTTSTMYLERPDRFVAPGYMWMSGTSFAAPVVSGAAADVLSKHPSFTPDQVKGALMLEARPIDHAAPNSMGVGEVKADAADDVLSPPNPNLALNSYLAPDPNGGTTPVFDTASWSSAAFADASWNSASWASASWASASWASASWASASWASGSLADGTLPTASWASSIFVQ